VPSDQKEHLIKREWRATFRGGTGLTAQADMPLNGGGCATPEPNSPSPAQRHRRTFRKNEVDSRGLKEKKQKKF